jgi:MFS family permease
MLSAFGEDGLVTNFAAMLSEHGVTIQAAALALSAGGGAGIVDRLFTGFLIDRFAAQRIQTAILSLSASGTLILAFSGTSATALIGSALLRVGLGSEADVAPYLPARYFRRKHFSVLYGLTWTSYAIGGATHPMVVGQFYDRAGSYQPRCIVGLASTTSLAAVIKSLPAPRPETRSRKTSYPGQGH